MEFVEVVQRCVMCRETQLEEGFACGGEESPRVEVCSGCMQLVREILDDAFDQVAKDQIAERRGYLVAEHCSCCQRTRDEARIVNGGDGGVCDHCVDEALALFLARHGGVQPG